MHRHTSGKRAEHRLILKIAANLRTAAIRFSRLSAVTVINSAILAINYNATPVPGHHAEREMRLEEACVVRCDRQVTHAAWRPGSTLSEIAARCRAMASVLHQGMTRAAPLPSFGQIAPKM